MSANALWSDGSARGAAHKGTHVPVHNRSCCSTRERTANSYLVDSTWHEALLLRGVAAAHGVGLARASLAVAEEAHVEAVQCTLHQLRHTVKHLQARMRRWCTCKSSTCRSQTKPAAMLAKGRSHVPVMPSPHTTLTINRCWAGKQQSLIFVPPSRQVVVLTSTLSDIQICCCTHLLLRCAWAKDLVEGEAVLLVVQRQRQ